MVGWVETVVTRFFVTRSDVHSGGPVVHPDTRDSLIPAAAVTTTGDVEDVRPTFDSSSGNDGELDFVVVGGFDDSNSSAFSQLGPTGDESAVVRGLVSLFVFDSKSFSDLLSVVFDFHASDTDSLEAFFAF